MSKKKDDAAPAAPAPAEAQEKADAQIAAEDLNAQIPSTAKPFTGDDMEFVTVRNRGKVQWGGVDFRPGGDNTIEPGGTGRVTRRKAEQLVEDYGAPKLIADDMVPGPFEIVSE